MNAKQQSLLYLHSAVLLFGGTALFSKLIGLSALDITVYRAGVAAIFLLIFLSLQKQKIKLANRKDYGIALLLGVVVGIHWVTYFAGMQMAGVTIGIIAFFTYPVITVFLEPLLARFLVNNKVSSKPKQKDVLIAFIVILGIFLLIPEISLGNQVTLGIITGVLSALFFALRNILHKNYFSHYSGPHTMLYQTLVACLMLAIFVEVPPMEVTNNDLLLILLVGSCCLLQCHMLYLPHPYGICLQPPLDLISCLQPLYGSLLAFILLSERVDVWTIIGGLLVISAALFETWSVSKGR